MFNYPSAQMVRLGPFDHIQSWALYRPATKAHALSGGIVRAPYAQHVESFESLESASQALSEHNRQRGNLRAFIVGYNPTSKAIPDAFHMAQDAIRDQDSIMSEVPEIEGWSFNDLPELGELIESATDY